MSFSSGLCPAAVSFIVFHNQTSDDRDGPTHSALIQHMILKCENASRYMHVSGIKMIGRMSTMQIQDYFGTLLSNFWREIQKSNISQSVNYYTAKMGYIYSFGA